MRVQHIQFFAHLHNFTFFKMDLYNLTIYPSNSHWAMGSQRAMTLGLISIRHQSNTFTSGRYLIDVDPRVFQPWPFIPLPIPLWSMWLLHPFGAIWKDQHVRGVMSYPHVTIKACCQHPWEWKIHSISQWLSQENNIAYKMYSWHYSIPGAISKTLYELIIQIL